MTVESIKKRLSKLIDVRKSCVIGDAEHDKNCEKDIEALQAAIEAIDQNPATIKESKAEPSTTAPDNVNHPSHYETNGIECIDAMIAAQGADAVQDFCICNAFKYIWRHKYKNGAEDIKKAVWYLTKWLELEGIENDE